MAKQTTIKAEPRARTGSGRLNQMRREGWLPSVYYGRGVENKNIKIDAREFSDVINHSESENIVVTLDIAGDGPHLAFLKTVQHDAITGAALHADFLAIDEKSTITAPVPVHVKGEAPGVKSGGVMEQYVHSIEVTCLPKDLPEFIDVDVSDLKLGDSLHLGDVKLPKNVEATHPAEVVVVHIGKAGPTPEQIEQMDAIAPEVSAEAAEDGKKEEA